MRGTYGYLPLPSKLGHGVEGTHHDVFVAIRPLQAHFCHVNAFGQIEYGSSVKGSLCPEWFLLRISCIHERRAHKVRYR